MPAHVTPTVKTRRPRYADVPRLNKMDLDAYSLRCIRKTSLATYRSYNMNKQIDELCRLIGSERDPDKLRKLAQQLDFALNEAGLQAQNKAFYLTHEHQERN